MSESSTSSSSSSSTPSCGLKNSLCQDNNRLHLEPVDPLYERFAFVTEGTISNTTTTTTTTTPGQWTFGQDYGTITCPVGGIIVFYYPQGMHDILQVDNRHDWESCEFLNNNNSTNTTILSPPTLDNPNSTFADVTYYYHCSQPGAVAHVTCSVPGHCQANQTVIIETSTTEYAYDPLSGNWTLEVHSLARLLQLLGYRQEPLDNNNHDDDSSTTTTTTTTIVMDHGYQTEALATTTTELIWCALDHCPHVAWDFDPTATREDCQSIVWTLLGFVSRKRPIPQWNVSQDYYHRAIDTAGSNNHHGCTAQSYLSQLYMTRSHHLLAELPQTQQHQQRNDDESFAVLQQVLLANATRAIASLCHNCTDQPNLIQQARHEYMRLGLGIFNHDLDFDAICASATTSPPSSSNANAMLFLGRRESCCFCPSANSSTMVACLLLPLLLLAKRLF